MRQLGLALLVLVLLFAILNTGCAGLVSGTTSNPPPTILAITNVQVVSTTTSGAQIVWMTNVAADSDVSYGTATTYGSSTPVDPTMVTNHQVTLSGLAAGTTYYYQVQSTDSKNNNGKSGGHKFGTAGVSISGTITPTQGGSGATVTLSGTMSAATTTNGSGAYTFAGLPSGSYGITPSNSGYTFTPANQNVTVGTTNLTGVNFTATATTVAPTITTQPVNQTVTAGQAGTFNVTASGTAPLSYQWQKNGANLVGATGSSYTTGATTTTDSGSTFDVVVSNSAGAATSNAATLTVNATPVVPTITTQPANQTVTAGQTATFSVTATGTSPLGYQWSKNGTAIAGATSASYTTPTTTTSDNGAQFTVVVSNSAGSVTSNAATLTVNAPTYLLSASPTSLSFGNVNTGSNSSLAVTLTNSGNSSVTISNVTTTGAGFSASGIAAGSILTPNQSVTLNVTFAPTVAASVTGSVSVASNATNSPSAIALSGTGVQPNAALPVWVMSSLLRVGQTDAPGSTSSLVLSSARGETVDAQVVVQAPAGGLTNVNLSVSALTGPGGASIPASDVTLYREYYIAVTGTAGYGGGSNPPLGSGTYPEPLIPFVDPETGASLCGTSAALKACNATISAGQNQPYWIDISVPHGATISPAGTYTGTLSITSDQGNAIIPVTLAVWNFGLPVQPSEASEWTLWNPNTGNTVTSLAQALMRNKVMSRYDVAANASSDTTNFGLNRSGLDGYYYIGIQCTGSYSSLPSTGQISAAAANFPAGLPLDFYVADELNGCTGAYSALKTMGTNAHATSPSVKTIMTTNAPDPNLYNEGDGRSAIDHWVLLDAMQQWPSLPFTGAGDLWSYASCNTGFGNTPAWMVDYPPINERIQAGFLNWTQGATGILYWRADGWNAGNTIGSWNNVDTTGCGGGMGRPGDGIFIYPPGPIASTESAPGIRLKAIRDGIQDYEYAQILRNLGQLSFLNPIVLPIATSWTNWTRSETTLENVRQQLGQQLHLLAPPGF